MTDLDETAYHIEQRHRSAMQRLSDERVLAVIDSIEPLPDGGLSDPAWEDRASFDRLCLVLAAAEEIGDRRLIAGIRPLYERAALDDPWDLTQSMRHGPERAVADDWGLLTSIMRSLLEHERAGCRRSAVRQLGLLRDPAVLPDLLASSTDDPEPLVRAEACMSLLMLSDSLDERGRDLVVHSLAQVAEHDLSERVRDEAADLLADFDEVAAKPFRQSKVEWFSDPKWQGDTSGADGFHATRRVIRALIKGDVRHAILDAYLERTSRRLVMTPGSGVYPPAEPAKPGDGSAPDWRATIALWSTHDNNDHREPTGLEAQIELRRASPDEVRARLTAVGPADDEPALNRSKL